MLSLPIPPKCFAATVHATFHAAFARKVRARPSGLSTFEAIWVYLRYGPATRSPSFSDGFVNRLQDFQLPSFLLFKLGAWTFTPVGLAPTDHASLRWTHTYHYRSRHSPHSHLQGARIGESDLVILDGSSVARFDAEHHKRAGRDHVRIVSEDRRRFPPAAGFLSVQNQLPALLGTMGR